MNKILLIAGIMIGLGSCGDPSRYAAREAAELEAGRVLEGPSVGPDTTINKSSGGGTGVRDYEADSIIWANRQ